MHRGLWSSINKKKHHTWTLLERLTCIFSYPWCCFSDFNEVLNLQWKSWGNDRNINMVAKFREVVQACNLVNMGYKGYLFTWLNRRYKPHHVRNVWVGFYAVKTGIPIF